MWIGPTLELKMKKLVLIVTLVCCIFLMCSCDGTIKNPGNTETIEKNLENYDSQSFANKSTVVTGEVNGNDITALIR